MKEEKLKQNMKEMGYKEVSRQEWIGNNDGILIDIDYPSKTLYFRPKKNSLPPKKQDNFNRELNYLFKKYDLEHYMKSWIFDEKDSEHINKLLIKFS